MLGWKADYLMTETLLLSTKINYRYMNRFLSVLLRLQELHVFCNVTIFVFFSEKMTGNYDDDFEDSDDSDDFDSEDSLSENEQVKSQYLFVYCDLATTVYMYMYIWT